MIGWRMVVLAPEISCVLASSGSLSSQRLFLSLMLHIAGCRLIISVLKTSRHVHKTGGCRQEEYYKVVPCDMYDRY